MSKSTFIQEIDRVRKRSIADGTFMLAPNGQPSLIRDEYLWCLVRTQAFRQMFGIWDLAFMSVPVISTTPNIFSNLRDAKSWAKLNLVGSYRYATPLGDFNLRISSASIDKFLSFSSLERSASLNIHLSTLLVLPSVIKSSLDVEQHKDYQKVDGVRHPDNGVNEDVLIHRLYGAIEAKGELYRVKSTIKQYLSEPHLDNKLYTYETIKIELLAGRLVKQINLPNPSTNNSISATKLLKDIKKSYSDDLILGGHSISLDHNGEPRVHRQNINGKELAYFIDTRDAHTPVISSRYPIEKKEGLLDLLHIKQSSIVAEASATLGVDWKKRKINNEAVQSQNKGLKL